MERFQRDNHALHLRYAGVAKSYRRQGIFRALVQQVMKRSVLLIYHTLLHYNGCAAKIE